MPHISPMHLKAILVIIQHGIDDFSCVAELSAADLSISQKTALLLCSIQHKSTAWTRWLVTLVSARHGYLSGLWIGSDNIHHTLDHVQMEATLVAAVETNHAYAVEALFTRVPSDSYLDVWHRMCVVAAPAGKKEMVAHLMLLLTTRTFSEVIRPRETLSGVLPPNTYRTYIDTVTSKNAQLLYTNIARQTLHIAIHHFARMDKMSVEYFNATRLEAAWGRFLRESEDSFCENTLKFFVAVLKVDLGAPLCCEFVPGPITPLAYANKHNCTALWSGLLEHGAPVP
jgi:hypothetical protein